MEDSLQPSPAGASAPSGDKYFLTTRGKGAATDVQIPNTGSVWLRYTSNGTKLDISFNGKTYVMNPPGEYLLNDLKTPLGLRVDTKSDGGEGKLEWVVL